MNHKSSEAGIAALTADQYASRIVLALVSNSKSVFHFEDLSDEVSVIIV